jgi:hypothetical protein
MASSSDPGLLVLHALMLMRVADHGAIAERFRLAPREVGELLLDAEARGWVRRLGLAGVSGWALTSAGHREHSRQLAEELADADARPAVLAVYEDFKPLNERFLATVTYWKVRPTPLDPRAANDHRDPRWDERVLIGLHVLVREVGPLCARLEQVLDRFGGYADRLTTALRRVDQGDTAWLDQLRNVSLHAVWLELDEDLRASLHAEKRADA